MQIKFSPSPPTLHSNRLSFNLDNAIYQTLLKQEKRLTSSHFVSQILLFVCVKQKSNRTKKINRKNYSTLIKKKTEIKTFSKICDFIMKKKNEKQNETSTYGCVHRQ